MAQVSFAASATVFRERLGFTDSQYGSIFLPQIALATLGAIAGGALARRLGLRRLLVLGTAALAASQAALLASVLVGAPAAFLTVLAGTGLMGLGAGLSAAPMNAYPQLLFPFGRETAVVGVHAVNGLGLTAGPLLAGLLLASDAWVLFPMVLGAANLGLAIAALRVGLPGDPRPVRSEPLADHAPVHSAAFWAFVAMASISGGGMTLLGHPRPPGPSDALVGFLFGIPKVLQGDAALAVPFQNLKLILHLDVESSAALCDELLHALSAAAPSVKSCVREKLDDTGRTERRPIEGCSCVDRGGCLARRKSGKVDPGANRNACDRPSGDHGSS
jgi:MFS family permease